LAFLSPEIVRGAIDGKLPRGIGVSDLTDLPFGWAEQRELVETSGTIVN
jgi:site-specific DNA recombinase